MNNTAARLYQFMMVLVIGLLSSLQGAGSAAAFAIFYDDHRSWQVLNGWKVYRSKETNGCQAEHHGEDGTFFLLGRWRDINFVFGIGGAKLNSFEQGKDYKPEADFDNGGGWYLNARANAYANRTLLLAQIRDPDFKKDLEKDTRLVITFEGKHIAQINLKGVDAVLESVEACFESIAKEYRIPDNLTKKQRTKLNSSDPAQNKANAHFHKGRYSQAERLYRRALALREDIIGSENPYVAQTLHNLSATLYKKGEYSEAEQICRRALTIRERLHGEQHRDTAQSLSLLTSILQAQGKSEVAEPYIRRALRSIEYVLGPDHTEVAQILGNLANGLSDLGKLDDAESIYRRALDIKVNTLGPKHRGVAQTYFNIGNLYERKLDDTQSEQFHRKALEIRRKALRSNHPEVIASISALASARARLRSSKGDTRAAIRHLRSALRTQEKNLGRSHPNVATTLSNLAAVYRVQRNVPRSRQLLSRVLDIRKRTLGTRHPLYGDTLNNLSLLNLDSGRNGTGLKLAREAADIGHPRRGTYLLALHEAKLREQERLDESIQAIQRLATSSSGAALQSLAVRFAAGSDALAALVRDEQDKVTQLERIDQIIFKEASKHPVQRNRKLEKQMRQRAEATAKDIRAIRAQLKKQFPDYAELRSPSPLGLDTVQSFLESDEALVIVDIAAKNAGDDYTWAITKDTAKWVQLKTKYGDIEKLVKQLRQSLELDAENRSPLDPKQSYALYRKLLGPIQNAISDKKHLIFVLNGVISSLPPQVLVSKQPSSHELRAANWLVRQYAVTVLPTVGSLKVLRGQDGGRKASNPFVGYGDPVFGRDDDNEDVRTVSRSYTSFFRGTETNVEALKAGLSRLPATADEIRAVANSVGATESDIILRDRATETSVKNADLYDYNIVYFATHGLVAGEVQQVAGSTAEPALALSIPDVATDLDDGLLTASEIAQLKLNADWIVMSACNTAAGGEPGADALSGLARAFFYAGARSLLVSHWVVDDTATAVLMTRVFSFAAKNKDMRAAEALRRSIVSMIDDPNNDHWSDPAFWAPFILVGEPR